MTDKNKDALKITNQFRNKRGMVYDLKGDGARLTVCVSPRESAADTGDWRVEARIAHSPEAFVITEWGHTRAEALRAVGLAWVAQTESQNLPTFDWDAVASVLNAVRAL
jgi:hypothetical protein